MPTKGLRLFRLFGVTVWLHWSWLLVAGYVLWERADQYSSQAWNAAEYLALFGIVLMHEFGHALACRSVGGTADRIMLWPFGGVAFVRPPPRPGAVLWSIAAGPLVNVVLLAPLWPFLFGRPTSDLTAALHNVAWLNVILLVFNLLPIYPLDGGQILQSLLWFAVGRANSLSVATVIGMVGAVGLGGYALYLNNPLAVGLSAFVLIQAVAGWRQAGLLRSRAADPRRPEWTCPGCGAHPPVGPHWICSHCRHRIDAFGDLADCPNCGGPNETAACPDCGTRAPYANWSPAAFPVVRRPAGPAAVQNSSF